MGKNSGKFPGQENEMEQENFRSNVVVQIRAEIEACEDRGIEVGAIVLGVSEICAIMKDWFLVDGTDFGYNKEGNVQFEGINVVVDVNFASKVEILPLFFPANVARISALTGEMFSASGLDFWVEEKF